MSNNTYEYIEKINYLSNELKMKDEIIKHLSKKINNLNVKTDYEMNTVNKKPKNKRVSPIEKNIINIINNDNPSPSPKKYPTIYGYPLYFGDINTWRVQ